MKYRECFNYSRRLGLTPFRVGSSHQGRCASTTVAVRVGNARRAVREFKVHGENISFSLFIPLPGLDSAEHEFSGRVRGDRIEGRMRMHRPVRGDSEQFESADYPWRAVRSAKAADFAPTGVEVPR